MKPVLTVTSVDDRVPHHPFPISPAILISACSGAASGSDSAETGCFLRPEREAVPLQGRYNAIIRIAAITHSPPGSVLILALWTLFFLGALALAVGAHVAANLKMAGRLKTRSVAYYLAGAGVEKAMLEAAFDTNVWDGLTEPWSNDEESFRDVKLGDGSFTVSHVLEPDQSHTFRTGSEEIVTRYGLADEERKININKARRPLLESLVRTAGGVDAMTASEIASAIWDWQDTDDVALTAGAESPYYQSLTVPYSCHNDDFQSLYELLLVKGMGQELFSRLERHMTIYGTGKININTAGPVVLRALAGSCGKGKGDDSLCKSLAEKIVRFREAGNVFTNTNPRNIRKELDGFASLAPEEGVLLSQMMGSVVLRSTCFGGVAEGRSGGEGSETATRRISFVFDRKKAELLYWHEY